MEIDGGLVIVNFSHPLIEAQREQIEALAGRPVERIIDVATHFVDDRSYAEQVQDLAAAARLSAGEWQTLPLLINLPGFAPVVAVLLAHLHGLMGHFPTILRLRPVAGSTPARFEVAEAVNLQQARDQARGARFAPPKEGR